MLLGTRVLPMIGLIAHLDWLTATSPHHGSQPTASDGGPTAGPTAGVTVIGGRVDHWVALIVAKLLGAQWKG